MLFCWAIYTCLLWTASKWQTKQNYYNKNKLFWALRHQQCRSTHTACCSWGYLAIFLYIFTQFCPWSRATGLSFNDHQKVIASSWKLPEVIPTSRWEVNKDTYHLCCTFNYSEFLRHYLGVIHIRLPAYMEQILKGGGKQLESFEAERQTRLCIPEILFLL